MTNVSVDLAKGQLEFIEGLIDRGVYRSRSEAVRDVLRRAEFDWQWNEAVAETKKIGMSSDIEKERTAASKKLMGRFKNV